MNKILILLMLVVAMQINAQEAQEAELLGTWFDATLPASSAHDNTYNEVWGLSVNDHEFAIIGSTFGTHIIDVTDPTNPTELFVVEGGSIGTAIIHRDFHDYQGYLYTTADEGSNTSLQIVDIRNLPTSIEIVYDSRELFTRSHNIFIDESTARLYSLISNGTSFGPAPMRIFDISDPIDPKLLGTYNSFNGVMVSQVHDAYVKDNLAYLNLGPKGFAIVDFTDVDEPILISYLSTEDYPQAGYNHSGWPSENGDFYYMADENFGKDMKVLDLRNLPDINVPTLFNAGSSDITIPHNQIVKGDKLYVSYYYDGLQVYDISDPINPVRELYYSTSNETPTNGRYRGVWGVYPFLPSGNILVSDMQEGLFVVANKPAVTSTQEVAQNLGFDIFPNPTNGNFKININGQTAKQTKLVITDMMGKNVYSSDINTATVDLSIGALLSNGLYNVQLINGTTSKTKRLIIKD